MHWLADSLRYRRSTTANSYLDAKQLKAGKTTNPNPDPDTENLSTKEKAKAKSAKTGQPSDHRVWRGVGSRNC
jgi:hypothetical protein